jgi:hypothetical protein
VWGKSDRGGTRIGATGLSLALLCVLLGAVAAAAAGDEPTAGSSAARPQVISPQAGATVPARPLEIRLRTRGARRLAVSLNGRPINRHMQRRRGGLRRLSASPNHGLRFGGNRLRVASGPRGHRLTQIVRFRIRRTQPLAAAGLDVVTTSGDRIALDGTESRPHRPGGKLRYRWSLAGGVKSVRRARRSGVRLTHRGSATPIVRAGNTRRVQLRLTATSPGGEVGRDLVQVSVDPAPSVRLLTGAQQGTQWGIALRGPINAFYPGAADEWLQVLVLDRRDLTLVSNKSYDCPAATAHPRESEHAALSGCVQAVSKDLASLAKSKRPTIAVAVNLPGPDPAVQPPAGVGDALGGYVAPWEWWSSAAVVRRGTFAAVFQPGESNGQVQLAAPDPTVPGSGMIDDNLFLDNEGRYSLVSGQRPRFETQAPGSSATQNVIAVGGRSFAQALPANSRGGFQVLVLDARTLEGRSHWFETHGSPAGVRAMQETLAAANSAGGGRGQFGYSELIFVAGRGNPTVDLLGDAYPSVDPLATAIEEAGGSRSRFLQALGSKMSTGNSYTLAGRSRLGHANGDEVLGSGPSAAASLNTAPLSGVLARAGRYYEFRVENADPLGSEGQAPLNRGAAELLQVAGQGPTPWPEQGNPGRTAAVEYLGEAVFETDNPRTQYWTRVFNADEWARVATTIEQLPAPLAAKGFDAADFLWARRELVQEIAWLRWTYAHLEKLAKPFDSTEFQSWSKLQRIADEVENEVKASEEEKAEALASGVFELTLDIGEEVPLVGKVVGAASAVYHFGMEVAKIEGESAGDNFSVKVGRVGEEFTDRLAATQSLLIRQLPDAIASDYGRLKAIGTCSAPTRVDWAGCPFDHEAWEYTQVDQETAAKSLLTSSEGAAYGAIVPAKYSAFELPIQTIRQATTFSGLTLEVVCHWPFADSPASAQYARPMFREIGLPDENLRETWIVTALGELQGDGTIGSAYRMKVPEAGVTDQIFGDGKGQLNLSQEDFLARNFRAETDLKYPLRDSPTGWLSRCSGGPPRGEALSAPGRVRLGVAVRRGVDVPFEVPRDGSTARVTLALGSARPRLPLGRRERLRDGSVLATLRLRNAAAGSYPATLRIRRPLARRVRQTRRRRATVWLQTFAPGGERTIVRRQIALLR